MNLTFGGAMGYSSGKNNSKSNLPRIGNDNSSIKTKDYKNESGLPFSYGESAGPKTFM